LTLQRALVVVAVAAAAWFGWRWLFPDDEAQIRSVLEHIAETMSRGTRDEGEVARLARVASLRTALDPEITVDAGQPFSRIRGRDALIGSVARFNAGARDVEFELADVQVHVALDRSQATVYLTAEARFVDANGGRGLEARELNLTMKRRDGDWVVSAITPVRTLEPLKPR
jgi:hypothetical protein